MRNIKLTLEYDGSAFFGFQRQSHHPTIQQALEEALSKLLNRKTKISAASGRTDTGVHAAGQVVNFRTSSAMSCSQMQRGLNSLIPQEIVARKVQEVSKNFHARYQVKRKVYEYKIWNHPVRSPLQAFQVLHISAPLHLPKMRRAAGLLKGRHDFRSFCSNNGHNLVGKSVGGNQQSTIRHVRRIEIQRRGSFIRVLIEADGFLYRMVRNIVGMLIDVGIGRLALKDVSRILNAKDRRLAGGTAPAYGLTLADVTY